MLIDLCKAFREILARIWVEIADFPFKLTLWDAFWGLLAYELLARI